MAVSQSDPKPAGRTRNGELLAVLHMRWQECALCYGTKYTEGRLSLHHISRHPRDDVEGNLVMLCGDGTRGCHGLIEAHELNKQRELASYLRTWRSDTLAYLDARFPQEGADAWLQRVLRG